MAFDLIEAIASANLAEDLEIEILEKMSQHIMTVVEEDDESRSGWMQNYDDWMGLALQIKEEKNYPWPKASNIKYPLITRAALQFHARALPNLINSAQPVQVSTFGENNQESKIARAIRVEKYMSYQVMHKMSSWVDEMDRMLVALPIVGCFFKKTYYSSEDGQCKSTSILPKDFIVNYHAEDLDSARCTHRYYLTDNDVYERVAAGLFLDEELEKTLKDMEGVSDEVQGTSNASSVEEQPYEIMETHCWYDLDDDGYKEPYIVTWHRDTGTILRIVARWSDEGIEYNEREELVKIVPDQYFTAFHFIPNPESAIYALGFGHILGPLNESVNTLINQLTDAGTLNNLQGGFLARGAKIRGGTLRFKPGEWKITNTAGDDLRKSIVPMPTNAPSVVLLQLMQFLIASAEQVSSVSDMMVGESPGQNQPASTTMAVLEQGLQVFTGIFKRVHRALASEYKKIYDLDGTYLDVEEYRNFLDVATPQQAPVAGADPSQQGSMEPQPVPQEPGIEDFQDEGMDIMPASDPDLLSEVQRSVRAQSLLEKAMAGLPINMGVALKMALEAEGHDNIEALLDVPEPQPDPKLLLEERKLDLMERQHDDKMQVEQFNAEVKAVKEATEGMLNIAKAESEEVGAQFEQYRAKLQDMNSTIQTIIQLDGVENERNLQQEAVQPGTPLPSA